VSPPQIAPFYRVLARSTNDLNRNFLNPNFKRLSTVICP